MLRNHLCKTIYSSLFSEKQENKNMNINRIKYLFNLFNNRIQNIFIYTNRIFRF